MEERQLGTTDSFDEICVRILRNPKADVLEKLRAYQKLRAENIPSQTLRDNITALNDKIVIRNSIIGNLKKEGEEKNADAIRKKEEEIAELQKAVEPLRREKEQKEENFKKLEKFLLDHSSDIVLDFGHRFSLDSYLAINEAILIARSLRPKSLQALFTYLAQEVLDDKSSISDETKVSLKAALKELKDNKALGVYEKFVVLQDKFGPYLPPETMLLLELEARLITAAAENKQKIQAFDSQEAIQVMQNIQNAQLSPAFEKLEVLNLLFNEYRASGKNDAQVIEEYEAASKVLVEEFAQNAIKYARSLFARFGQPTLLEAGGDYNALSADVLKYSAELKGQVNRVLLASDRDAILDGIRQWIAIACECQKNGDYFTANLIVTALSEPGITKIIDDAKRFSPESDVLAAFQLLFNPKNGGKNLSVAIAQGQKAEASKVFVPPLTPLVVLFKLTYDSNPDKATADQIIHAKLEEYQEMLAKLSESNEPVSSINFSPGNFDGNVLREFGEDMIRVKPREDVIAQDNYQLRSEKARLEKFSQGVKQEAETRDLGLNEIQKRIEKYQKKTGDDCKAIVTLLEKLKAFYAKTEAFDERTSMEEKDSIYDAMREALAEITEVEKRLQVKNDQAMIPVIKGEIDFVIDSVRDRMANCGDGDDALTNKYAKRSLVSVNLTLNEKLGKLEGQPREGLEAATNILREKFTANSSVYINSLIEEIQPLLGKYVKEKNNFSAASKQELSEKMVELYQIFNQKLLGKRQKLENKPYEKRTVETLQRNLSLLELFAKDAGIALPAKIQKVTKAAPKKPKHAGERLNNVVSLIGKAKKDPAALEELKQELPSVLRAVEKQLAKLESKEDKTEQDTKDTRMYNELVGRLRGAAEEFNIPILEQKVKSEHKPSILKQAQEKVAGLAKKSRAKKDKIVTSEIQQTKAAVPTVTKNDLLIGDLAKILKLSREGDVAKSMAKVFSEFSTEELVALGKRLMAIEVDQKKGEVLRGSSLITVCLRELVRRESPNFANDILDLSQARPANQEKQFLEEFLEKIPKSVKEVMSAVCPAGASDEAKKERAENLIFFMKSYAVANADMSNQLNYVSFIARSAEMAVVRRSTNAPNEIYTEFLLSTVYPAVSGVQSVAAVDAKKEQAPAEIEVTQPAPVAEIPPVVAKPAPAEKPVAAELERGTNTAAAPKTGKTPRDELINVNDSGVQSFIDEHVHKAVSKFGQIEGGKKSEAVEFSKRYLALYFLFQEISEITEADPIKKAVLIAEHLVNGGYIALAQYNPIYAEIMKNEDLSAVLGLKTDQTLQNALGEPQRWAQKYQMVFDALLKQHDDGKVVLSEVDTQNALRAQQLFKAVARKSNELFNQLDKVAALVRYPTETADAKKVNEAFDPVAAGLRDFVEGKVTTTAERAELIQKIKLLIQTAYQPRMESKAAKDKLAPNDEKRLIEMLSNIAILLYFIKQIDPSYTSSSLNKALNDLMSNLDSLPGAKSASEFQAFREKVAGEIKAFYLSPSAAKSEAPVAQVAPAAALIPEAAVQKAVEYTLENLDQMFKDYWEEHTKAYDERYTSKGSEHFEGEMFGKLEIHKALLGKDSKYLGSVPEDNREIVAAIHNEAMKNAQDFGGYEKAFEFAFRKELNNKQIMLRTTYETQMKEQQAQKEREAAAAAKAKSDAILDEISVLAEKAQPVQQPSSAALHEERSLDQPIEFTPDDTTPLRAEDLGLDQVAKATTQSAKTQEKALSDEEAALDAFIEQEPGRPAAPAPAVPEIHPKLDFIVKNVTWEQYWEVYDNYLYDLDKTLHYGKDNVEERALSLQAHQHACEILGLHIGSDPAKLARLNTLAFNTQRNVKQYQTFFANQVKSNKKDYGAYIVVSTKEIIEPEKFERTSPPVVETEAKSSAEAAPSVEVAQAVVEKPFPEGLMSPATRKRTSIIAEIKAKLESDEKESALPVDATQPQAPEKVEEQAAAPAKPNRLARALNALTNVFIREVKEAPLLVQVSEKDHFEETAQKAPEKAKRGAKLQTPEETARRKLKAPTPQKEASFTTTPDGAVTENKKTELEVESGERLLGEDEEIETVDLFKDEKAKPLQGNVEHMEEVASLLGGDAHEEESLLHEAEVKEIPFEAEEYILDEEKLEQYRTAVNSLISIRYAGSEAANAKIDEFNRYIAGPISEKGLKKLVGELIPLLEVLHNQSDEPLIQQPEQPRGIRKLFSRTPDAPPVVIKSSQEIKEQKQVVEMNLRVALGLDQMLRGEEAEVAPPVKTVEFEKVPLVAPPSLVTPLRKEDVISVEQMEVPFAGMQPIPAKQKLSDEEADPRVFPNTKVIDLINATGVIVPVPASKEKQELYAEKPTYELWVDDDGRYFKRRDDEVLVLAVNRRKKYEAAIEAYNEANPNSDTRYFSHVIGHVNRIESAKIFDVIIRVKQILEENDADSRAIFAEGLFQGVFMGISELEKLLQERGKESLVSQLEAVKEKFEAVKQMIIRGEEITGIDAALQKIDVSFLQNVRNYVSAEFGDRIYQGLTDRKTLVLGIRAFRAWDALVTPPTGAISESTYAAQVSDNFSLLVGNLNQLGVLTPELKNDLALAKEDMLENDSAFPKALSRKLEAILEGVLQNYTVADLYDNAASRPQVGGATSMAQYFSMLSQPGELQRVLYNIESTLGKNIRRVVPEVVEKESLANVLSTIIGMTKGGAPIQVLSNESTSDASIVLMQSDVLAEEFRGTVPNGGRIEVRYFQAGEERNCTNMHNIGERVRFLADAAIEIADNDPDKINKIEAIHTKYNGRIGEFMNIHNETGTLFELHAKKVHAMFLSMQKELAAVVMPDAKLTSAMKALKQAAEDLIIKRGRPTVVHVTPDGRFNASIPKFTEGDVRSFPSTYRNGHAGESSNSVLEVSGKVVDGNVVIQSVHSRAVSFSVLGKHRRAQKDARIIANYENAKADIKNLLRLMDVSDGATVTIQSNSLLTGHPLERKAGSFLALLGWPSESRQIKDHHRALEMLNGQQITFDDGRKVTVNIVHMNVPVKDPKKKVKHAVDQDLQDRVNNRGFAKYIENQFNSLVKAYPGIEDWLRENCYREPTAKINTLESDLKNAYAELRKPLEPKAAKAKRAEIRKLEKALSKEYANLYADVRRLWASPTPPKIPLEDTQLAYFADALRSYYSGKYKERGFSYMFVAAMGRSNTLAGIIEARNCKSANDRTDWEIGHEKMMQKYEDEHGRALVSTSPDLATYVAANLQTIHEQGVGLRGLDYNRPGATGSVVDNPWGLDPDSKDKLVSRWGKMKPTLRDRYIYWKEMRAARKEARALEAAREHVAETSTDQELSYEEGDEIPGDLRFVKKGTDAERSRRQSLADISEEIWEESLATANDDLEIDNLDSVRDVDNDVLATSLARTASMKGIRLGDISEASAELNELVNATGLMPDQLLDGYKEFLKIVKDIPGINDMRPDFLVAILSKGVVVNFNTFKNNKADLARVESNPEGYNYLEGLQLAVESELRFLDKQIQNFAKAAFHIVENNVEGIDKEYQTLLEKAEEMRELRKDLGDFHGEIEDKRAEIAEQFRPVAKTSAVSYTVEKTEIVITRLGISAADAKGESAEKAFIYHPEKSGNAQFEPVEDKSQVYELLDDNKQHIIQVTKNSISYTAPESGAALSETQQQMLVEKMVTEVLNKFPGITKATDLNFEGTEKLQTMAKQIAEEQIARRLGEGPKAADAGAKDLPTPPSPRSPTTSHG